VDDNLDKAIAKGKVVGAKGGVQKLTGKALQVALMAARLGLVCWVAREVLPSRWKDCRTYILFGSPRWFCKWYSENGERAAECAGKTAVPIFFSVLPAGSASGIPRMENGPPNGFVLTPGQKCLFVPCSDTSLGEDERWLPRILSLLNFNRISRRISHARITL